VDIGLRERVVTTQYGGAGARQMNPAPAGLELTFKPTTEAKEKE
jgi:hypothetical protein